MALWVPQEIRALVPVRHIDKLATAAAEADLAVSSMH